MTIDQGSLLAPADSIRLLRKAVRLGHMAFGLNGSVGRDPEQRVLAELRDLLNASKIATIRGQRPNSKQLKVDGCEGLGWNDDSEILTWASWIEALIDPVFLSLTTGDDVVTRCRRDVIDDVRWGIHPLSERFQAVLGVGDCVYSVIWATDRFLLLAAFRSVGSLMPFANMEVALLDVAAHVMQPKFMEGDRHALAEVEAGFTPKVREVLRKLLEGHSEKEIARQLNVAPSTVHSHVVAIYRRLKVGSRAELMSLLLNGQKRPKMTMEEGGA